MPQEKESVRASAATLVIFHGNAVITYLFKIKQNVFYCCNDVSCREMWVTGCLSTLSWWKVDLSSSYFCVCAAAQRTLLQLSLCYIFAPNL